MGSSAIIRHVQHLVYKIAENQSAVLITGELGTGKDAIAKIIHERSAISKFPFVPIKCAQANQELLEHEIFGINKDGKGLLAQADGGIIYFSEVGKLSDKLQLLLYKVISENQISSFSEKIDTNYHVRVICSTSVDLEQLVKRGQFREDLFYKLSASSIYLPPIRERREDIPVLAEYFVQKFNQLKGKKIMGVSHDAMNALLQNVWTHNIQELENLIERVVVLKNTGSIDICDLPPRLRSLVTDNIDAFYDRSPQVMNNNSSHIQQNSNSFHPSMQNNQATFNKYAQLNNTSIPPYPISARENALGNMGGINHGYPRGNYNPSSNQVNYNSQMIGGQASYGHNYQQTQSNLNNNQSNIPRSSMFEDIPSEIDQFIKKEIDLGSGIDFYRVVEEFENRLISEALRRTNHNKNRAAQLLSMNRTTLVEKLKKRATSSPMRTESGRVKRNSAFTIFDGLGNETADFDTIDFVNIGNDESP